MISFFSLPFLVIGLVIILRLENSLELKWILSFILTFSALLRMIPSLSKIFDRRIKKFEGLYLMVLGLVHGLTNLGGGLLTLYAASKGKEKIQMRGIISFGYLVFGIVQIIILLIFHSDLIHFKMILYPVSSGVIFYLVGNKIFKKIPEKLFTHLITLLIFLYGILLPLS